METVDLILFMGQSNMAGRGNAELAPKVPKGHGYEFRAISDPQKLHDAGEPFGAAENNPDGVKEGLKSGSLVSAFMNAYYEETGIPIVGVSCSKGGSRIREWQPGGAYLNDGLMRYHRAKGWLTDNGYRIRHCFLAWCQGESDGDDKTPEDSYRSQFLRMYGELRKYGVEQCFLIRIGHYRDDDRYDYMIELQTKMGEQIPGVVPVSGLFAELRSQMKDVFHYNQEAYNRTGEEAGRNAGRYASDLEKDQAGGGTYGVSES